MIRDSGGHRRGDPQAAVNAAEVVICDVQRHDGGKVFQLLREATRQSRKPLDEVAAAGGLFMRR
jgi:hypothetical protein